MKPILFPVFFVVLLFCGIVGACEDGWGAVGSCVRVTKCASFVSLLNNPPPETVARMRQSLCRNKNNTKGFHVCCADATTAATITIATISTTTNTTPSSSTTTTTSTYSFSTTFSSATTTATLSSSTTTTSSSTTTTSSSIVTSPSPTTTATTGTPAVTPPPLNLTLFDPTSPEGHRSRLLLPHPSLCGQNGIGQRIVGGQETNIGEFPWLALIGYEDDDYQYDYYGTAEEDAEPAIKFLCGATLISTRYVVTAAHCIPRTNGQSQIKVIRFGEHNLNTVVDCQGGDSPIEPRICNDPPVDIPPEKIIAHRRFHKPHHNKNDIALIRLQRSVQFTVWISPICLPFAEWRSMDMTDRKLIVAGFGLTKAYGDTSVYLQKLKVPVVNMSTCGQQFRSLRAVVGRGQMCAGGEKGRDSCKGDSGGPLMAHSTYGPPFYLMGVVSFGTNYCGGGKLPGVYTSVADFMMWIVKHIQP